MTISYQNDVASSTAGGFTRLLFKWKVTLIKIFFFSMELKKFYGLFPLIVVVERSQHSSDIYL